jgi:DNA polymerase
LSDEERALIAAELRERLGWMASLTDVGLPRESVGAAPPPGAAVSRPVEAVAPAVPAPARVAAVVAPAPARVAAPAASAPTRLAAPEPTPARKPAKSALPEWAAPNPSAEPSPVPTAGEPEERLKALVDWIGNCQRCALAPTRNKIVYGQGNLRAEIMFVGEAPGADEDEQGLAFVGRAGQLLTDIIEKGLKVPRSEVFIANVIKCRPPQNRNPETAEILACQPFLEQQIDIIRPKVLVGLGKFSGQWLLKTAEPISRIRGRFGEYTGIPVMPTFHPAYLLRNPSAKKDVWEDLKLVLRHLGRSA